AGRLTRVAFAGLREGLDLRDAPSLDGLGVRRRARRHEGGRLATLRRPVLARSRCPAVGPRRAGLGGRGMRFGGRPVCCGGRPVWCDRGPVRCDGRSLGTTVRVRGRRRSRLTRGCRFGRAAGRRRGGRCVALAAAPARAPPRAATPTFLRASRARACAPVRGGLRLAAVAGNSGRLPALVGRARTLGRGRRRLRGGRGRTRRRALRRRRFLLRRLVLGRPLSLVARRLLLSGLVLRAAVAAPTALARAAVLPALASATTLGAAVPAARRRLCGRLLLVRFLLVGADAAVQPSEHALPEARLAARLLRRDRKSTRLNSSHVKSSYAVFCLKKKNRQQPRRNV